MPSFEEDIVELFNNADQYQSGASASVIAQEIANEQEYSYNELMIKMQEGTANRDGVVSSTEIVSFIQNMVQTIFTTNPVRIIKHSSDSEHSDFSVVSQLPILRSRKVSEFIKRVHRYEENFYKAEATSFQEFLLGALLSEVVAVMDPIQRSHRVHPTTELQIAVAVARYTSVKKAIELSNAENQLIHNGTSALKLELETIKVSFDEELKSNRENLKMTAVDISNIDRQVSEANTIIAKTEEDFQQRSAKLFDSINSMEASIRQQLSFSDLENLWGARAKQSKTNMIYCIILGVIFAVAGVVVIIVNASAIIDFVSPNRWQDILTANSYASVFAHQIGRIVIISVPLLIYIWALKIIVRFIIRSLLLMDDASQREIIMTTYYALVRDGHTDDRALPMMLFALFRQVPGHGPDGIEPPDFTEVINAGMGKGSVFQAAKS